MNEPYTGYWEPEDGDFESCPKWNESKATLLKWMHSCWNANGYPCFRTKRREEPLERYPYNSVLVSCFGGTELPERESWFIRDVPAEVINKFDTSVNGYDWLIEYLLEGKTGNPERNPMKHNSSDIKGITFNTNIPPQLWCGGTEKAKLPFKIKPIENTEWSKPRGGLWTSEYTPNDAYCSDWVSWMARNEPTWMVENCYVLVPRKDAKVYTIYDEEDLVQLDNSGYTKKVDDEIYPDFEKLSKVCDGLRGGRFLDWDCESTVWFRNMFERSIPVQSDTKRTCKLTLHNPNGNPVNPHRDVPQEVINKYELMPYDIEEKEEKARRKYPEGGIGTMILKEIDTHRVNLVKLRPVPKVTIKTAADVANLLKEMKDYDREWVKLLHLDTKNRVIGIETISIGTIDTSIVHPRETAKGAVLMNSSSVIFVHNHPSGICTPSPEDTKIYQLLKRGLTDSLRINLLDGVIIAKECYYSMEGEQEFNYIKKPPKTLKTEKELSIMKVRESSDGDIWKQREVKQERILDRLQLKESGVRIDDPPILVTVGNTKTVVGTVDGLKLNFALGDVAHSDIDIFDTLRLKDRLWHVKKSVALSTLKGRQKAKGKREGKQMKMYEEWGGLEKYYSKPKQPEERAKTKYTWEDDFVSVGGRILDNGTVWLYHATKKDIADEIRKTGILKTAIGASKEYGIYFGSNPSVGFDYGDGTVIAIRVRAKDLVLDDVYPNSRADFNIKATQYKPIEIGGVFNVRQMNPDELVKKYPRTKPWVDEYRKEKEEEERLSGEMDAMVDAYLTEYPKEEEEEEYKPTTIIERLADDAIHKRGWWQDKL